jgi:hypothetical protein
MGALKIALVTSLIVWAGGCCLSAQKVDERYDALHTRNRERAQPAMLAAAAARGATLLPVEATYIANVPRLCAEGTRRAPPYTRSSTCTLIAGDDSCIAMEKDWRSFVLHRRDGASKLAIIIPVAGWRYTRLARRGNRVFILRPRLSPGKVKRALQ